VATRLATLVTGGAALLVLVLYAPALQAPFLVPKFAVLELTASLGFLAFALQRATMPCKRWSRPATLGAFSVLAATLLAWIAAMRAPLGAPYAVADIARWGAFFGLACGASILDDVQGARQRVLEAVTVGAGVVAAVGLIQHVDLLPVPIPVISTPGSTFGNRNMAAEAMAMALPLGLGALASARPHARRAMLGALALEVVFLAVTRTRGAWLGGILGLGTAVLIARRRWSRASIAAGAPVFVAAVMAATVPGRLNSHDAGDSKRYSGIAQILSDIFDTRSTARRTRLGFWRRTLVMVREHPFFGVGPGNWPVLFPGYAEPGAAEDGVLTATLAPRQAHNDLLQCAAESGVLGLLALGVLMTGTTLAVRRRLRAGEEEMRATTAGAAGALVALVALCLASFPLEMPGTLALGGLALGLVAVDPRAASKRVEPPVAVYAALCVGVLFVIGAVVRAERAVRTSRWLGAAERSINGNGDPREILRDLQRALSANPRDFRARLRMAQVLLGEHRPFESAAESREALVSEPYSPNAWAELAAAEMEAGDHAAARRDTTRALTLLHDYPFALQLRITAAEQEGDLDSARADRQDLTRLATTSPDPKTSSAAIRLLNAGK
jgi:O-antigen ligase